MTSISFNIPKQSFVKLKVFDATGKEVVTLANENREAGTHKINFFAGNLASGVYFYRLEADGFVQSKKMILMK
jgi:hypothetical protein